MENNHVSALRAKHETLEKRIQTEEQRPSPDTLLIHRLKKEKLAIKEELLEGV